VPVPGRDLFVQAWYQGGVSVMDFTDSRAPVEIAYFDRGPVDAEDMVMGGYWSVYWYDGHVYGTEIARGLDVFSLLPSEHLSEAELSAARTTIGDDVFNPQQQFPVRWQNQPIIARARLDQLQRDELLPPDRIAAIAAVLDQVQTTSDAATDARAVAAQLRDQADMLNELARSADVQARRQLNGLAETLVQLGED